jgi:hypothetical protein
MTATSHLDRPRATWRKSRHSNNGGNCVEVAIPTPGTVVLRDSRDPDGPVIAIRTRAWRAFTAQVKATDRR